MMIVVIRKAPNDERICEVKSYFRSMLLNDDEATLPKEQFEICVGDFFFLFFIRLYPMGLLW